MAELHSEGLAMRLHVGLVAAAVVSSAVAGGLRADGPRKSALPGWYGVFPEMLNYARFYEAAAVDPKAKDVYAQTVRYDWMGNDFRVFTLTLARDPAFKTKYDADTLKAASPAPTEIKVGKYRAWSWELPRPAGGGLDKPNSRLAVILGDDRVLLVEAAGSPRAADFPELSRVDLDRLAAALDRPPLATGTSLERFRALPKGATYGELVEWVGRPEKDVGSGIHIMTYPLDDGSRVTVGTPDFRKVVYVKHEGADGKVTDLLK